MKSFVQQRRAPVAERAEASEAPRVSRAPDQTPPPSTLDFSIGSIPLFSGGSAGPSVALAPVTVLRASKAPGLEPRPGFEEAVARAAGSQGQPLPSSLRSEVEGFTGANLSGVRIHTGGASDAAASALLARAYTQGQDIHFASGQYRPGTPEGDRLVLHEAVHTVQQGTSTPVVSAKSEVSAPGDAVEQEADAVADAILARRSGASFAAPRAPPDVGGMGAQGPVLRRASSALLLRDVASPPAAAPVTEGPAPAELTFSLSGMDITARQGTVYKPGPKKPQGLAIILKRLMGGQYRPGLELKLLAFIEEKLQAQPKASVLQVSGQLEGSAEKEEQVGPIHVGPGIAQLIVRWLDEQGFQVDVSTSQRKLLAMGVSAQDAWADLQDPQLTPPVRVTLPAWYNRFLFERELSRRIDLLQAYATAAAKDAASKTRALQAINDELSASAAVLEAIRADPALVGHPVYLLLWAPASIPGLASKAAGKGKASNAAAVHRAPVPPGTPPEARHASNFLGFVATQPLLGLAARVDAASRKDLLDRFLRFAGRMVMSGGGDERLFGTPPKANAPPLAAYLTSYPGLQPPLYQASLGTDYAFEMHVEYPDIFDAMASYGYFWERVRIPDSQVASMLDASQVSGARPSMKEVARERFARVSRYNEADMKLVMGNLTSYLGPPGTGAPTLVAANAIMRYVGTAISLGFEILSTPAREKHIVFPEGGYYLVRCRAARPSSNFMETEVVRPPSVAYMPVVAQPARNIAETQATEAGRERTQAAERLAELEALLQAPVTYANQKELEDELAALKSELGSLGSSLQQRRDMLQKRLDSLAEGSLERRSVQRQLDYVDDLLKTRGKRVADRPELASAERLVATFVNDEGQIIQLALELVVKSLDGGGFEAYLSDLTTTRSGHAVRSGATRTEAINAALKHLLTEQSEYGRGHVSAVVDGKTETQRIEAGTNRLMMEALENLTTALSIAAVAAAPFTGGASLAILLPVGAVGAIPSAYRLASRAENATLRFFDLETAMDIVNIVGGFAGVGEAVTPLRMVRLGKAFMWMGVGSGRMGMVLMGAQLVEQLDALEGLPPGLRAARAMQIIGNAMLSVGLMAGTELAMRGRAREMAEAARGGGPMEMPTDAAVGAVRGKVYEGLKPGKLSVERLETSATRVAGREMLHGTKLQKKPAPQAGKPAQAIHYTMEVPQAGGKPAIKVEVELHSTSELPPGPHLEGGIDDSGPGRVVVTNEGGQWKARILVERNLHEVQEAPHVLVHEFNEIADLVHRHPSASQLTIKQQQQASLYKKGSSATDVTAHDRAAARELMSLHEEIPKLQSNAEAGRGGLEKTEAKLQQQRNELAAKPSSSTQEIQALNKEIQRLEKQVTSSRKSVAEAETEFGSKQARLDRMLDSMGLGEPVNLDKKLATLRESGASEQLVEYAHDRMMAAVQEPGAKAAHAAYAGAGRPHSGVLELDASAFKHVMYPADVNTSLQDWRQKGLSGGHDNGVLQDWLRNRPRIHMVETGRKSLPDGSKVFRYEQYRWKGPGDPPPVADGARRPGGASYNPDHWLVSGQPKTTAESLPAMMALAEDAFMTWYSKNKSQTVTGREFGPENVQGVVLGGYYKVLPPQPPDTVFRFRLLTAYVEASWF